MKKIICQFLVFLLVLGISAETVPAKIMAAKNNTVLSETSTKQEIDDLRQIYKELFPAEYHYIEEYEKNGVSDKIQQENLKIIFDEVRKHGNKEYTLCVYNNGQIFTNIAETISEENSVLRMPVTKEVTKSYRLGDLGHYNTFTVTYIVELYGYDYISSYNTNAGAEGGGFLLYPYCFRFKKHEDATGNAYVGYYNVSMNMDGSGLLYDLGVIVGHDTSQGFCRLSSGLDSFIRKG